MLVRHWPQRDRADEQFIGRTYDCEGVLPATRAIVLVGGDPRFGDAVAIRMWNDRRGIRHGAFAGELREKPFPGNTGRG